MATVALVLAALRIGLAIVLDTAALLVWDVGTRSPLRLARDIRDGLRRPATIARGLARVAIGAFALLAAATVSAPVATRRIDFTIIECWALVTALVVEQLIGPDLRARRR